MVEKEKEKETQETKHAEPEQAEAASASASAGSHEETDEDLSSDAEDEDEEGEGEKAGFETTKMGKRQKRVPPYNFSEPIGEWYREQECLYNHRHKDYKKAQ